MPTTTSVPRANSGVAQLLRAAAAYAESRALDAQATQSGSGSLHFKNKSKKRRSSKNKKKLRRKYKNKKVSRKSTGGFRKCKRKSLRKKSRRKYKRRNSRKRR